MIKIEAFKWSEMDKANEFMKTHTPIASEKEGISGGLKITGEHLIVIYEDGEFNNQSMVDKWRALRVGEIAQIEHYKHQILKHKKTLDGLTPKGYKQNLKDEEVRKLLVAEGMEWKEAGERVRAIVEVETQMLMATKTIDNAMKEIELYTKSIKSYEK